MTIVKSIVKLKDGTWLQVGVRYRIAGSANYNGIWVVTHVSARGDCGEGAYIACSKSPRPNIVSRRSFGTYEGVLAGATFTPLDKGVDYLLRRGQR